MRHKVFSIANNCHLSFLTTRNPLAAMPLCGGGKTVHRKLVLLYALTTFYNIDTF